MKNDLKNCPFCGWKPMVIAECDLTKALFQVTQEEAEKMDEEIRRTWGVKCFSCGGMIDPQKETREEAIKAWNRRYCNDAEGGDKNDES